MTELSPLAKNALETLATIRVNREKLDQLEYIQIRDARIHGASWRNIAITLGVTDPTARSLYSKYDSKWGGLVYRDGFFQPVNS